MKALLRRFLSENARARVGRQIRRLRAKWVRLYAASDLLTFLHYVSSPHFFADFSSYVKGSARFYRYDRKAEPNISELRRDIHRLEKGLSFPKRRLVFGLRFIESAVEQFCVLAEKDPTGTRSEFKWAKDVLQEYFNVTASEEPRYKRAKARFELADNKSEGLWLGHDRIVEAPQAYRNSPPDNAINVLTGLLCQRKSIRRYSEDPVDQQLLDKALDAASLAPSSCNRQPYTYYMLTEARKAREAAAISAGTAGWVNEIQNMAILVGDRSYFSNAVNRHSIYVDSALSVMPFVLTLEAQGVSTCLINWADDAERRNRMATMLGLKSHQRVIVSIAFGYANAETISPFSKRKFGSEISQYV